MRIALNLNDICQLIVEKLAPGKTYNARLSIPPEGLKDANAQILVIDITQPPPPSLPPPSVSIRATPG